MGCYLNLFLFCFWVLISKTRAAFSDVFKKSFIRDVRRIYSCCIFRFRRHARNTIRPLRNVKVVWCLHTVCTHHIFADRRKNYVITTITPYILCTSRLKRRDWVLIIAAVAFRFGANYIFLYRKCTFVIQVTASSYVLVHYQTSPPIDIPSWRLKCILYIRVI